MSRQAEMISWSTDYNLGLEEIDDQHKYLIDLINRLWHAIVHRSSTEEVLGVLNELEHYTVSHFTAEEVFMRTVEYPEFETHKGYHKEFTSFIAERKQKAMEGEAVTLDVLHYLKDWLLNHILKADKAYSKFYQESRAPKSIFQRLFGRFGR